VEEKRYWFLGYWEALQDFSRLDANGKWSIGGLPTPIKKVAKEKWIEIFPLCECKKPMDECPGCMTDF